MKIKYLHTIRIDFKRKRVSFMTGERSTTTMDFSCFNPYLVLRNRLHGAFWKFVRKKFKEWNIEHVLCQGCGYGIAKYRIRDPNHGYGNRKYNCCKGCYHFYDRRWSNKEIVAWKPVMKKEGDCPE